MAGAGAPIRQDSRKFFENLSGAGKAIAVLTSGGDAQGNSLRVPSSDRIDSAIRVPEMNPKMLSLNQLYILQPMIGTF